MRAHEEYKTPLVHYNQMVFGKGKQTNMKEISTNAAKAKHNKHSQNGKLNPNWKDGISKDNYHYRKIQKARFPKEVNARELVFRAIKTGKLIKPDYCSDCGVQKERNKIEAHHEDYNEPLKVVWLCKYCHRVRHE